MDSLIANKTMSTLSLFGPEFAKTQGDKVLLMPGPSWYGGAVFQGSPQDAQAARSPSRPPLAWADADSTVTGNVGGGAWWISSHSTNLKAASDFATWVTTHDAYQADLAPGYPAYTAAATKWLAKTAKSGYYANDIAAPIQEAAGQVWPGWGSAAFSQEAVWAKVVQAGMGQGKTIESPAARVADRDREPGQDPGVRGLSVTVVLPRGRQPPTSPPGAGPAPAPGGRGRARVRPPAT